MSNAIKTNLKDENAWKQVFFIAVFTFAFCAAGWLVALTTLAQVGFRLIAGGSNARLAAFGVELGAYLGQLAAYMTCGSQLKPFPYSDWPGAAEHRRYAQD